MRVPVEVVPDPDVPGCGNIFVRVDVDDRVVRAVLDTGAGRTTLIDLPVSARLVGDWDTAGLFGAEIVPEWEVVDVRVGSLHAAKLAVNRIDPGTGRYPVLGLDVLGTAPWQLDASSSTLLTGVPSPRAGAFARGAHGHILTEMKWPTATAKSLWDTGASVTLIDRRFADEHPDLFVHAGSAKAVDFAGSQGEFQLARTSGYEINGTAFAEHTVAIADLSDVPDDIDAAIGFPTIAQARWTVDVPARRWSIHL